jgi:hypothetical protein
MTQKKSVNSVVILLGGVHACSANHDIREFKVRIYNSVDLLPDSKKAVFPDVVPGVLSNSELEEQLENLRNNIAICWHGVKVDQVLKEEDSL